MTAIDGLSDAQIRAVLDRTRRVAIVGASDKPDRPSFGVMTALLAHGYAVVPVNPGLNGRTIQEQRVVASLAEALPLDMVDVFRRSSEAGAVVDDAIRLGASVVWMQLGVIDGQAAQRGRRAGIVVVMDRCPKIEFARLSVDRLGVDRLGVDRLGARLEVARRGVVDPAESVTVLPTLCRLER